MCAKRVMDIMRPVEYPVIPEDMSLRASWEVLCRFIFSAQQNSHCNQPYLLVCNGDDQLVGMLGMRDMLKMFNKRIMAAVQKIPGFYEGNLHGYLLENCEYPVKQITSMPEEIMLKSWDSTYTALRLMLKYRMDVLSVVNIYHKAIGMVHSDDVYQDLGLNPRYLDYWRLMA